MNSMQMASLHDDENRKNRKEAHRLILSGKRTGLDFILSAIDKIQTAQRDLRFALKATEEAARLELKYVNFLYWNEMDENIDDLRKRTDRLETLLQYIIEALRNVYDDSKDNTKIDWRKIMISLTNAMLVIDDEPEIIDDI